MRPPDAAPKTVRGYGEALQRSHDGFIRRSWKKSQVSASRNGVPVLSFSDNIGSPLNGQVRIVPQQHALVRGLPIAAGLVDAFGPFDQRQETMGKSRRNPSLAPVSAAEHDRHRRPEGGRSAAYVEHDIEYRAPHDAHQFALPYSDLVMQSAHGIRHRDRLVILAKMRPQAGGLFECVLVTGFEENATLVLVDQGLDQQPPRECRSLALSFQH